MCTRFLNSYGRLMLADIDNYNVAETHDQLVQMLSNLEKNIYNGARRTI